MCQCTRPTFNETNGVSFFKNFNSIQFKMASAASLFCRLTTFAHAGYFPFLTRFPRHPQKQITLKIIWNISYWIIKNEWEKMAWENGASSDDYWLKCNFAFIEKWIQVRLLFSISPVMAAICYQFWHSGHYRLSERFDWIFYHFFVKIYYWSCSVFVVGNFSYHALVESFDLINLFVRY